MLKRFAFLWYRIGQAEYYQNIETLDVDDLNAWNCLNGWNFLIDKGEKHDRDGRP